MIRATHAKSPDCPSKVIKHSCCPQFDAPGCQSGINEHIGPACIADNGKVVVTCTCHQFSFSPTSVMVVMSYQRHNKVQATKLPCSCCHEAWSKSDSDLSIDMEVANQENHLVSDVLEKTMSAFSDRLIAAAEESNAMLQGRSNQKTNFLMLLPKVKIPDSPLFLLCSKTVLVRKETKATIDACHLGHNIHQDRGAHRHQFQRHQLLTLALR
jgi:hypothetical protein